jgi:hypothetical protein
LLLQLKNKSKKGAKHPQGGSIEDLMPGFSTKC